MVVQYHAYQEKEWPNQMLRRFHNLNRACPKDEFPLPNMDLLIDFATEHAMFSFMDGFRAIIKSRWHPRTQKNRFQNFHRHLHYDRDLPRHDASRDGRLHGQHCVEVEKVQGPHQGLEESIRAMLTL